MLLSRELFPKLNIKFSLIPHNYLYKCRLCSNQSNPLPPTTTTEEGGATAISSVYPDILEAHILTRLDAPTLASASCMRFLHPLLSLLPTPPLVKYMPLHVALHRLFPLPPSPHLHLPKRRSPLLLFSLLPLPTSTSPSSTPKCRPPTSELISAVDIHYQHELIFSKVHDIETITGWFRFSPFRIDLRDPEDVVPTRIPHPEGDDTCTAILNDRTLSWILIDRIGRQAMNLSSLKPVSVQRHWLSGEVQVRFATVLSGDLKGEWVQCEIVVTCGGSEGGEMQVREVSLEMEDMDGMHLNGKDSLVILERAFGGKRGKGMKREEEGRRRHREYEERKRERRERKMRTEGALDILFVALTAVAAFWFFVLCV